MDLLYKLKYLLPSNYYFILKSYLKDCFFSVQVVSTKLSFLEEKADIPQDTPILFHLFIFETADLKFNFS